MNKITPYQPAKVTAANFCTHITPYRVTSVFDRTIYEFWKIGCAETSMRAALRDPKTPRQLATLTFFLNKKTFQLCFYPWQDQPQIMEEVALEKLPEVVADLLAAGFGGKENLHGVPDKIGAPVLTENKRVQLLSP